MIKKVFLGVSVLVLAAIAYYGISPLFRNIALEEALPGDKSSSSTPSDATTTPIVEDMPPAAEMNVAAQVEGTLGHPASGTARLVSADGAYFVRYENYKTINGPDLYVYLAKDKDAKEFVSLGRLKATEGNFNYEVPSGVDPKDYPYVLTWCKAFSVLFNSAKLI